MHADGQVKICSFLQIDSVNGRLGTAGHIHLDGVRIGSGCLRAGHALARVHSGGPSLQLERASMGLRGRVSPGDACIASRHVPTASFVNTVLVCFGHLAGGVATS